jgi:hypothetical protein
MNSRFPLSTARLRSRTVALFALLATPVLAVARAQDTLRAPNVRVDSTMPAVGQSVTLTLGDAVRLAARQAPIAETARYREEERLARYPLQRAELTPNQ